jgi:hypothetical protein
MAITAPSFIILPYSPNGPDVIDCPPILIAFAGDASAGGTWNKGTEKTSANKIKPAIIGAQLFLSMVYLLSSNVHALPTGSRVGILKIPAPIFPSARERPPEAGKDKTKDSPHHQGILARMTAHFLPPLSE